MESFMDSKQLLLLCGFLFKTFLGHIHPILFQCKMGKQNPSSRREHMTESEIQKSWKLIRDVLEMRLPNQPLHPAQTYAQLLCFVCRGKLCEAWKESRHSLKTCLIFYRTASSVWGSTVSLTREILYCTQPRRQKAGTSQA